MAGFGRRVHGPVKHAQGKGACVRFGGTLMLAYYLQRAFLHARGWLSVSFLLFGVVFKDTLLGKGQAECWRRMMQNGCQVPMKLHGHFVTTRLVLREEGVCVALIQNFSQSRYWSGSKDGSQEGEEQKKKGVVVWIKRGKQCYGAISHP
eukprot:1141517-Pelagomonas_calceolata.AAC.4